MYTHPATAAVAAEQHRTRIAGARLAGPRRPQWRRPHLRGQVTNDSAVTTTPLGLCITGDGIRWENLVLFPAYPTGITYFRAMRYADRFIDPATLRNFRADPSRFVGREVIIYIRFLSNPEAESVIIPLRKAEVVQVDYMPENLSIFVKLGPMYDFRGFDELRDAALSLNSQRLTLPQGRLVFEFKSSPACGGFVTPEEEHNSWTRYVDLLAGSTLPVAKEARAAIFLRMRQMETRRGPFAVKRLHDSSFSGSHYGSYMVEGERYEFIYCHRIPSLIGSKDGPRPFTLRYGQSDRSVRMSRDQDSVSQNYETHVLELAALHSSSLNLEELTIAVEPKEPETLNSQRLYAADLRIPYLVGAGWLYRFRRTGGLVALLAVSFFLSSLVSLYTPSQNSANPSNGLNSVSVVHIFISFGLASLAAAIVFIIQRRGPS